MKPDVVDTYEIAQRLQVETDTVHRWRQRFSDFPPPDFDLKVGPVWLWATVEKWAKRTGRSS